jgi:hypothetical protein
MVGSRGVGHERSPLPMHAPPSRLSDYIPPCTAAINPCEVKRSDRGVNP